MSWEEWVQELLNYAEGTPALPFIKKSTFMYEDYFEQGLTPEEAFHAEWG